MDTRWYYVIVVVGVIALLLVMQRVAAGPLIKSAEAKALVTEGATLVDVRTPEEYASGHIQGAVNIPLQQFDSRAAEIPSGKPVVLYCRSGARSGQAASILRGKGRTDVHNLGGMGNW
ncbi:MAG: rhodanese-like domain-containing protein [Polyangiaceae bacterium]|nr:rhodanese-like domain-containing protein [Polyangiaceae bacterium]